jgi:poly-beta-1,6-N-acetyl-D-glucosamine synthase
MDFGTVLIWVVAYFGLFTGTFFLLTLWENPKRLRNPRLPEDLPSVTVAVPAYNEEKTIAKTVESLLALDYPKRLLKIMVIDDGSTDRTYEVAMRFEKRGVTVLTKKNSGKAAALNLAISRTDTELFGALDADSFVSPRALKRMVGYFRDSDVMAVTPSLVVHRPESALQKVQYIEYMIGIFLRKVFAYLDSIHVTPGPFTIYRKSFFDRHGGYDENNLTEDIEVALRMQKKGYRIENSVNATVYTVSPSKFTPLLRQRLRWYIGFTENVARYRELFGEIW